MTDLRVNGWRNILPLIIGGTAKSHSRGVDMRSEDLGSFCDLPYTGWILLCFSGAIPVLHAHLSAPCCSVTNYLR